MTRRPILPALAVAVLLAAAARGQQVRAQPPVAGVVVEAPAPDQPQGGADPDEDIGVAVVMFENANLDRYLHKAQDFLAREDYAAAIQVLQDVIDGRTIEAVESKPEPGAPEGAKPEAGAPKPTGPEKGAVVDLKDVTEPARNAPPGAVPGQAPAAARRPRLDASQAVFSPDGRLYRPVRRLCQELLARMPGPGLQLYRSSHEVEAEQLLAEALASGDLATLEQVANRFFVTLAGGKAMALLADRLLHEGRYRAAVQVLRDLLEVYPQELRRQLGLQEVWLRFKIALAMRLSGDPLAAREAARQLAAAAPDESLRLQGELLPVRDLPSWSWFAGDQVPVAAAPESRPHLFGEAQPELMPLWRFRFASPQPYQQPNRRNQGERFMVIGEGAMVNASPPAWKYGVGTRVTFSGEGYPAGRALFFDHFRLRLADAFTGLQQRQGDGKVDPPKPRDNQPRVRVPVYDHANLLPVEDGDRCYALLGWDGSTSTVDVLTTNRLVAYQRDALERLWSSEDWHAGEPSMKGVTLLAAPTVFEQRLLLPVLRDGAYALQCLDRSDGKPLWCTPVHGGGSPYTKAPGSRVVVVAGIAYLLTNAGAVAAIDAFAGDLRWIRRYERSDPYRVRPRSRTSHRADGRFGVQFIESDLPSHLPSDLLVTEGLLVFAPCDGNAVVCLDTASGQPVWMLDSGSRHAPYGRLHYLVGANAEHLFLAGESDLVCVGLRTGVQLWHKPMAQDDSLGRWRGRGCVLGDVVLLPGAREVLALRADGKGDWLRLPLPAPAVGEEPLRGPCNLSVDGPWLGVAYEAGIEVYSSKAALRSLAAKAEPVQAALYLAQAGDLEQAIGTLERDLATRPAGDPARGPPAALLLGLARERAEASARAGDRERALAVLDRVGPMLADRRLRMDWHVTRLDVFKRLQDLPAVAAEQQRLYRLMEGKD